MQVDLLAEGQDRVLEGIRLPVRHRAGEPVGPDGVIRNVTDEGRLVLGSPSRVAFDTARNRLYVADSSNNQIVAIDIPKVAARPRLVGRPPAPAVKKVP